MVGFGRFGPQAYSCPDRLPFWASRPNHSQWCCLLSSPKFNSTGTSSELCERSIRCSAIFPDLRKSQAQGKKAIGHPWHVSDLSWGVFGPRAITYFAKKLRLLDKACPPEVFYPVHEDQAHGPFCSGFDVEKLTTPNTLTIHLWNEMLRQPSDLRPENPRDTLIIERGCFVERFCRKELSLQLVTNG